MKAHQRTEGKNDEWLTPMPIIQALGSFDLDPASCEWAFSNNYYGTSIRAAHFLEGLEQEWYGRVWLNPPFNRYERPEWMAKMADHNNGIMLIPAACETDAFYNFVWPKASGILFLKGRPHFHYADGTRAKANSGCTICLVSYGSENLEALYKSNLGKVLPLNPPT